MSHQDPETLEGKVDELLALQRALTIKLFGDLDQENERGRLPMLERQVDDHAKRIRSLENFSLRWIGATVAVVAIIEVISYIHSIWRF